MIAIRMSNYMERHHNETSKRSNNNNVIDSRKERYTKYSRVNGVHQNNDSLRSKQVDMIKEMRQQYRELKTVEKRQTLHKQSDVSDLKQPTLFSSTSPCSNLPNNQIYYLNDISFKYQISVEEAEYYYSQIIKETEENENENETNGVPDDDEVDKRDKDTISSQEAQLREIEMFEQQEQDDINYLLERFTIE